MIEARLVTAPHWTSSARWRLRGSAFLRGPIEQTALRSGADPIMRRWVALGMLIIDYVYPMQLPAQIVMTMIAAMSAAIIALSDMLLARLLLALAIAVAVPAVAVLATVIRTGNLIEGSEVRPIVSAFHAWLTAVSIAVAGGLVVAGILSDRAFFVKSAQFLGVKASHTLPFALGGGLLWWYRYGEEYASGRIQVSRSVKRALLTPQETWHVPAAGTIGVFAVSGQTGNTFVMPLVDRRLGGVWAFLPFVRNQRGSSGTRLWSFCTHARSRGRCQFALYGALVGMVGLISVVNSFTFILPSRHPLRVLLSGCQPPGLLVRCGR